MADSFDWRLIPFEERKWRSKRWFAPFQAFKGQAIVRMAKSTGKPHLHVKVRGDEVCVTWKKGDKYLIHAPGHKPVQCPNAESAIHWIREFSQKFDQGVLTL